MLVTINLNGLWTVYTTEVYHPLLIQKLELFCLDNKSISWMESYLSNRCQSVFIDGCLSPPLAIECGVPQGSILGPLLYILFTNDVPDLAHDHQVTFKEPATFCQELFAMWMMQLTSLAALTQQSCLVP